MAGMRDATVRHMQIFAAAGRAGSFTGAARAVHLTQPAVSMQLKQLEHLAGLPLFERAGRGLRLTQAGEEMARHAQSVLRSLADAEDAFAALRGLEAGRLQIGAVSTTKYFAPKLIARFARSHPRLELRLAVANRGDLIRLLAENDVDLAIMGRPPREMECVAERFAKHPHVVIAPPDHPLARRRRVPLAEVAAESFLVREQGSGTRLAMEKFFAERGLRVRVGMEISSNETIKQAVMAGMGLSFISLHTVGLELAAGQLAVLRADGLPVMRDWYVVRRREKVLAPAAAAFERFVLAEGAAFLASWPEETGLPPGRRRRRRRAG